MIFPIQLKKIILRYKIIKSKLDDKERIWYDKIMISQSKTHISDHILFCVCTRPIEGSQKRLHMLGAVLFTVKQQHGEQLRAPDPCGHQPVSQIVGNGWHQFAQVSHHKLSAAQAWPVHWRT